MKKIRTKFIEAINKNESSWINLLILSFIALIIKQYCNYITYKNLNYWTGFYINSFFTDAIVVLIILWITILNQYIKNRIVKIFNNILCLIIFTIFCIDIFTIYFLQSRVAIFQAFQYVSNWSNGFATPVIFILLTIISIRIISLILTRNLQNNSKMIRYILISTFLILWGLTLNFSKPSEINNIISLNVSFVKDILLQDNVYALDETETNIQEEVVDEKIKTNYEDYIEYIQWDWKDLNIILVFAESLSAIDSANMWWNNNMPYFDKIQKEWITYTNFIANWKTSDTAHIATLYWIIPLVNIGTNDTTYSWYKLIMEPLPEYLNTQWYQTTFVSAASLDFLEQRDFLNSAWFQKIIWEEEFKNKKKYTFDAAPDKDLYDRVLEEVWNQTWKFFIWLQTISFHTPYNTPNGKTEKSALQYADLELYRFYKKLEKIWYFNNWILIILWDHRKTQPAEEWESTIFWQNRFARSVATVVWSWINTNTINNNIIQHTDFYNSIKKIVWNWKVEIDETYNDVFSDNSNRIRWITSARYDTKKSKYIVSYQWKTWFKFNNISLIDKENNEEIYNYLFAYMNYEFSNETTNNNKESNEEDKQWNNDTIIIGHQWARNYSTENSLESYLTAKKQWADWIELDISYTKDKENIVAHWEYFYGSNCKNYKINNYDYDRITKNCTLNNWEKYKKLKEMLELVDWLFNYYIIELKVNDESLWIEQTLDAIQTVKELNMEDRVIFISYSDSARKLLKSYPNIIFWWDTYNISDLDFIWENNSKYFLAPYDLLTEESIKKAQELWKQVITYTINDTWNFQKMKDLWVNIILTDEIELLRNYENTIKNNIYN